MIETIFASLPGSYVTGVIDRDSVYYFSMGTVKKTVRLTRDGCVVENGRTVDNADCVCKTDESFFLSIWEDGYRPGMGDFMSGKIKSNNPAALQLFLRAFGK
ncbi:MAG: hypothetical protein LJE64_09610 [Desulfofustis sp.]|nr:hypothetical protein [Desulfofustis sp.]